MRNVQGRRHASGGRSRRIDIAGGGHKGEGWPAGRRLPRLLLRSDGPGLQAKCKQNGKAAGGGTDK
ncbi:MAG: hypothetical protein M0Z75_14105 [Nitrospiraceae bacterium]|nr:hypothetical protein [Nitrospiraceae bacterium]